MNTTALPLPDRTKPVTAQDPEVLLAMCIWGEARSEPFEAQLAVGCVVRNRVRQGGRFGEGFEGVILKPYQFSSFNENDANRAKMLDPLRHDSETAWESAYTAAHLIYQGSYAGDPTRGAIFYFSPPLTQNPKSWGSVEFTAKLGELSFFRET